MFRAADLYRAALRADKHAEGAVMPAAHMAMASGGLGETLPDPVAHGATQTAAEPVRRRRRGRGCLIRTVSQLVPLASNTRCQNMSFGGIIPAKLPGNNDFLAIWMLNSLAYQDITCIYRHR